MSDENQPKSIGRREMLLRSTAVAAVAGIASGTALQTAQAQGQPQGQPQDQGSSRPPNILFIMGDDVGWFNIGAYHQGIMSGKTPNLDRLAT
ncbi:MAG: arylsulfatase, partial [Acetobacteraceae bacterium]|nr:arylsulfatase [Acetobacteraceae bacterium]